jgi:hypothetical protein
MDFPNPFRDKDQELAESILREAQEKAEREYGPIGKLGLAIVTAATNSRDRTKKYIVISDEGKRLEREVYLFFEHIYFFMHLAMRSAYVALSEDQMHKVQEYLAGLIPSVAVDSYFAHWSEDLKQRMVGEFIQKLNTSEGEYVESVKHSKLPSSQEKLLGLFVLHATHIIQLCERELEWETLTESLVEISIDEWKRAQFDSCVQQIKQAN